MTTDFPDVTRVYQNHHLDSTRWQEYQPRKGDVIITTAYKSGTTWTQQILHELFNGLMDPMPEFGSVTPWPDARFLPISRAELGPSMDAIQGRRFIKSHLPLDGLPYYPEVQYLIVGRDARGWFAWETEGWPFWANLGHTANYWAYRHLPNFHFMHYNDMLADLEQSVRTLCTFLGEKPSPAHLARIVENTTFANAKAMAAGVMS